MSVAAAIANVRQGSTARSGHLGGAPT